MKPKKNHPWRQSYKGKIPDATLKRILQFEVTRRIARSRPLAILVVLALSIPLMGCPKPSRARLVTLLGECRQANRQHEAIIHEFDQRLRESESEKCLMQGHYDCEYPAPSTQGLTQDGGY